MSKKILSVALALIFVVSTLAVSAFAVGGTAFEDDAEVYTQEWALKELDDSPDADGVYKVGVYLTTNYNVGAVQFKIDTDNAVLGGVESTVFVDGEFEAQYTEDGLVFFVPTPADNSAAAIEATNGAETLIATLSYTLADGAASATLAIADDAKSEENPGGSLIAVRMSDDNLVTGTMIYGQTATVADAITIGSAAAAELVVVDGTNGVIDTARMCVYGIDVMDAGQTIGDVFAVTNGGSIEVTPSNEGVEEGTGAVLVAKDAAGAVIGEYTVIIHGDVNGDGASDSLDAGILCEFEGGLLADFSDFGISDDVAFVAGDINADGGADSLDAGMLCEFEGGLADVLFDIATLPQELLALA